MKIKNIVGAKEAFPENDVDKYQHPERNQSAFWSSKGFNIALTAVEELELGGDENELYKIITKYKWLTADKIINGATPINSTQELATAIISQMDKWVRIRKGE